MAIESPLFQSSLELLGHGITHFNGGSELDRKLVILHLANAVELLLKDLVLDGGGSIYKNPKETISIHGAIEELKKGGTNLPHLNKIELLIDERNALQHRYGSPNELTVIFYMEASIDFFTCLLKEEYDLNFDETISQFVSEADLTAFRLRKPTDETELKKLDSLAKIHPLGAFLSVMTYLERIILSFGERVGIDEEFRRRPYWMWLSPRFLERYGVKMPEDLFNRVYEVRHKRNVASHGKGDVTKKDVSEGIKLAEDLEKFLDSIEKLEKRDTPEESPESKE